MKRRKLYLIILSIILGSIITLYSAFANEKYTVRRNRAVLRTGPGSYYPSIAELSKGTAFNVLKETDGWYKILVDTLTGYVSKKVTQGKTRKQDMFSQMGSQRAEIRVSQIGMSAGVKGFGEKFSKRLKGDPNFLEYAFDYRINQRKYKQFKKETYTYMNISKIRREIKLPSCEEPTFFTFSEEGMGLGIASKIAEIGLYKNRSIQDYVNYVGNLVVEASDVYDISFKFFILDSPFVNAYACPGGIVFITKAMLENLHSEAELACVLGHEIAHIARYHGMKEMEERKVQIIAEDSFQELDELTDTESDSLYKDVEQELEDIALSIYETIFAGRLEQYEEEADRLGLLYSARAGYAPSAMIDLLTRLIIGRETSNNEHYTKDQITWRKNLIQNFLNSRELPKGLLMHSKRLQEHFYNLK